MSKKFCLRCFNKYKFSGKKPKCSGYCKKKIVYFMRGVASCGKSYTAKLIAGKQGVVIETDSYFERPGRKFRFIQSKRKEAYAWVYKSLKKAIRSEIKTIVIDRGNNPSSFSKKLMKYALKHGYEVELVEPISEWWQEIKVLLSERPFIDATLMLHAKRLSKKSAHRMKKDEIYRRLINFNTHVKIEDFLNYNGSKKS